MSAFSFIVVALNIVGAFLLILVCVLGVEVLAGSFWVYPIARDARLKPSRRGRIAVLIPAHDEAQTIVQAIVNARAGLSPDDRVIVIADNCTDTTFELSRLHGAEAIRRDDKTRHGKGYALEFGIQHLRSNPPETVIVMDADCTAEPGCLGRLADEASRHNCPIQAHYEMTLPANGSSPPMLIALFAWHVKNFIRPLGLSRLRLPVQLTGTGMAFPWPVIATAKLGTAEIVEDLVLGLECAEKGTPPRFCAEARVSSSFPTNREGQSSQRARWETGHLHVILRRLPKFFVTAVRTRNVGLLALVIDCAVPPLAMLFLLIAGMVSSAFLITLAGAHIFTLGLGVLCAILFTASIAITWSRTFRDRLPLEKFSALPAYVVSKFKIYLFALAGRRMIWIRTKRD